MSRRLTAGRSGLGCFRGGRIGGVRVWGFAAVLLVARPGVVWAFPLIDTGDQVPPGSELASPDLQDLQHQLRLVNGLGAPSGGGWTFVPRVDWQEELTDNALQAHSPRQSDLISFISPGISIAGDLPRIRATFDFAPTVALYARTSDLNALTEQMNGLANVTLVPDLAFVDVRVLAGVQNLNGGLGGLGAIGAPSGSAATAQTAIPALAGNSLGLNRNNEAQTSTFSISPYLLRRFGDVGTGRLGDSFNVTRSDELSGFLASPFATGSAYGQTLVSNEEDGNFSTGEFLEFFSDTFDADLTQNQTTSDATGATVAGGQSVSSRESTSNRAIVTDQLRYILDRSLSFFASGGHEDISYSNGAGQSSGTGAPSVHDLTWSLGTTWAPDPDSSLTVSYGHQNGFNSLTVDGHYQATGRTLLTVSYGSTLGTQLEYLQSQLNLAGTNGTGTLVNGQTGGPLFGATNALGVQDGVFRTTTLNVGSTTNLDRDLISINLLMAKQESSGGTNSTSSQSTTASINWLHQMRPDMTVSAAFSFAIQDQSSGAASVLNPGNSTSIAASLAWQWQLSDTVSTSVRYSFFDRASSATAYDIYENILILGISKRF